MPLLMVPFCSVQLLINDVVIDFGHNLAHYIGAKAIADAICDLIAHRYSQKDGDLQYTYEETPQGLKVTCSALLEHRFKRNSAVHLKQRFLVTGKEEHGSEL
jgi:hypothetical protein